MNLTKELHRTFLGQINSLASRLNRTISEKSFSEINIREYCHQFVELKIAIKKIREYKNTRDILDNVHIPVIREKNSLSDYLNIY